MALNRVIYALIVKYHPLSIRALAVFIARVRRFSFSTKSRSKSYNGVLLSKHFAELFPKFPLSHPRLARGDFLYPNGLKDFDRFMLAFNPYG